MIQLDGSMGEGGGQILRTALALSLATQQAFRIEKIRAGRERPGILRQHLAGVRAATQIGGAEVVGAALGSQELEFRPGEVRGGEFLFDVGSAGSTTLVLQTVLLPLCLAGKPSDLTIIGGTHNPSAPPFEFLSRAFLPLVERMGPVVRAGLERVGFFPTGGGRIRVAITPVKSLARLDLPERGDIVAKRGRILLAHLPVHIADREHSVLVRRARIRPQDVEVSGARDADGPGNVVALDVICRHVTEVFTGFGRKGVPGEEVAKAVADEAAIWEESGVPVGPHLADQLLLPMALAGGGSFRTGDPTPHTTTNAEVIAAFLGPCVRFDREPAAKGKAGAVKVEVAVGPRT